MANVTPKAVRTSSKPTSGKFQSLFGESTRKANLDADWNIVDPNVVFRAVWAISTLGGSITLGTNKKGTAFYIKVYLGAPYDAVYFDGDADGAAALAEWVDRLVEAAAENA